MDQSHDTLDSVILLNDPRVNWFTTQSSSSAATVFGRGYAFIENGKCVEDRNLVNHILMHCNGSIEETRERLHRLIPGLNGAWAMAVKFANGNVLAATDRSRSTPLFYSNNSGGVIISSSPAAMTTKLGNLTIDDKAAAELLLSGYISGRNTLYNNIYKVQPAEIVEFIIQDGKLSTLQYNYFPYFPDHSRSASEEELTEELEQILESIFARFAVALQGRKIVLPLSGGYDSRLIGWMLYKNGIRDVLCYTYGAMGNPQVELARQVAKALGFEWKFIEYDSQRWARCMGESKIQEYWNYTFQGTSLPHHQDYPALLEIMEVFKSDDRPILLPGHVGDAWASEFVLKCLDSRSPHPLSEYHSNYIAIGADPVTSAIIYRHLNLWPVPRGYWRIDPWMSVADKIKADAASYGHDRDGGVWKSIEWVLRNRTALWILRSCRCAEFFKAEWRLCMGDYEIINFFRNLPLDRLYQRRIYAKTLQERIFVKAECPIKDIPIISGGRQVNPAKRMVLECMNVLGLYKPYEWWRRTMHPRRITAADTWFTQGLMPQNITVGEALEQYQLKKYLPSEIFDIVLPYLRKPAYAIQCNGLLATVILAREYARLKMGVNT